MTYSVMYRIGGRQVSDTFVDPTGAAEFSALVDRIGGAAARAVLKQRRGSPSKGRVPTVAQAVTDHIDALSGITRGTRSDYEKIATLIARSALGPLPVDTVTADAVGRWVDSMDVAAKTKRNRHGLLYAAMRRQVEAGHIGANPCERTKIGATEQGEMVTLTGGELAVILDYLAPRWHPLIHVLVGTGLRFGEATALQPRDFDLEATDPRTGEASPTVRVARAWKHTDGHGAELGPPKTKRGRRLVSLAPETVEVVRPLVDGKRADGWVFTNTRGEPIRQNSFHELWSNAIKAAQADGRLSKRPRIHDLRHTHASWLISAGVPLPVIQRRLGHESIKTTVDVYGHLSDDALSVAAQATSLALTQALPAIDG